MDVAVKRVPEHLYFIEKKYTQPEHNSLKQLFQHENVVVYYDCFKDSGWIYLVLERCDTDLDTEMGEWTKQNNWSHKKVLDIGYQICRGLNYIHKKGIIHRDLKPANILLKAIGNKSLCVKICDMGISRKLQEGRCTYSESCDNGSAGYRPYEILMAQMEGKKARHLSFSVDIFGVGCTFHMLFSKGRHPFGIFMLRDSKIVNREDPAIDTASLCYEAQNLIPNMIKHDSGERSV